jgi:PTH2 family peptidyl-tRNA hydrolase
MSKISKQVIVMRRDLKNTKGEKVRAGKLMAQAAHASLKAIFDIMGENDEENQMCLNYKPKSALRNWIEGRFTKICVSVNSEKELLEVYQKAKDEGLICSLITDAGLTEFAGIPTKTCCAIGPEWSDDIDKITGHLSLL